MSEAINFTLPKLTGKSYDERKKANDTAREQLNEWLVTNALLAFIQGIEQTFKKHPNAHTVEITLQDNVPALSVKHKNGKRNFKAEDHLIKLTQDFPDLLILKNNFIGGISLQNGNLFSQPDWETFIGGDKRFQHLQEMYLEEVGADNTIIQPHVKHKI